MAGVSKEAAIIPFTMRVKHDFEQPITFRAADIGGMVSDMLYECNWCSILLVRFGFDQPWQVAQVNMRIRHSGDTTAVYHYRNVERVGGELSRTLLGVVGEAFALEQRFSLGTPPSSIGSMSLHGVPESPTDYSTLAY